MYSVLTEFMLGQVSRACATLPSIGCCSTVNRSCAWDNLTEMRYVLELGKIFCTHAHVLC